MGSAVITTATAGVIVNVNPNRVSFILVNPSSRSLWVGETSSITTATGIEIQSNGNLTEDSGSRRMYLGPYYGITDVGSFSALFWERSSL